MRARLLLQTITVAAFLATSASAAPWVIQAQPDPMTDTTQAFMSLRGDGGTLVIGCAESGRAAVFASVQFDAFLGSGPAERALDYRFDATPMVEGRWIYSSRAATLMVPPFSVDELVATGRMVKPESSPALETFVRNLAGATKVVIRGVDYAGSQTFVTLEPAGTQAALVQVYAACGAGLPPGT